ncbi:hypothetical protein HO640_11815 [Streptococcus suis]|uniref:Plasmid recombination enzyme n=1 Tax=Streptococcus suis TaxID=1307 RepID=A0A0Z8HEB7_STRSU|nr:hypothetical protein [Streptococcus suis]NQH79564.1 hypothetical protein [Streptococcus suis]CYV15543.1 Uncharacterised protein [Streptococcus suis]
MSGISLHQNGKTFADLRAGLEDHLFREDEKDAERISQYTDSYINVNETKYNQTLFLNENEVESDENGRIKFTKKLRDEFTEMNVKRKSEGLRAKQKNANLGTIDTLQLSDEVLEAMGYEKFYSDRFDYDADGREIAVRKPWSEQTEDARRLVVQAYRAMIDATNDRPDLYGVTMVAQLHVDESTPHVERVSRMVDRDGYDFNASNIINGNHLGKGMRGKRWGQARQDHFAEKTREILGEEFSNRYKIQRGEKGSEKADKTKNLDLYEEGLKVKSVMLEQQRIALFNQQKALERREEDAGRRETALEASESRFNDKWDNLSSWEKELRDREDRTLKLDELKSEHDRYANSASIWAQKVNRVYSIISNLIEDYKLDDVERKAFNTALQYASLPVKENGQRKVVPFKRYFDAQVNKIPNSALDARLREIMLDAGLDPDHLKLEDNGRQFGD